MKKNVLIITLLRPLTAQKPSNNHRKWVFRWSNPLLANLDIIKNLQITSTLALHIFNQN